VGPRCSFCGTTQGPLLQVEGLFTLRMCPTCQAARSNPNHGRGLPRGRGEEAGLVQPKRGNPVQAGRVVDQRGSRGRALPASWSPTPQASSPQRQIR
jgi:hypothetical protein